MVKTLGWWIWSFGVLEFWSFGVLVFWSFGVLLSFQWVFDVAIAFDLAFSDIWGNMLLLVINCCICDVL